MSDRERIRIKREPMIESRHGVIAGREFEVEKWSEVPDRRSTRGKRSEPWIAGDAGELVRLLRGEWEPV